MSPHNVCTVVFINIVVRLFVAQAKQGGCTRAKQFASKQDFYLYKQANPGMTENEPLYRVWLTEAYSNDGAKCLDGSMPALYFRPGTGSGTNKWQIFLEGGGWCAGVGQKVSGMPDCYERAMYEDVGSSKTWLPYMSVGEYMSDDANENPLAYNWNLAYIKYCDGASFSGNNETTVSYNGLTLYFRGWRILNGALNLLRDAYGFRAEIVTDLLLSGCSAGGLATFLHAQYMYDEWMNANTTRFMAMPDAGFFLEYEGPNRFITGMQWIYDNQNVSIAMNKKCMQHYESSGDEWQCLFAQNVAPFVVLPLPGLFALQSQYDSFQISWELGANTSDNADINKYGQNVTQTLIDTLITVPNGYRAAFFDSCSHHCGVSWGSPEITIYNQSAKQAATQWYYNTNIFADNFWFQNQSYPCTTCGCPTQ